MIITTMTCSLLQHQQQVVTAVERAKQVTMSELNSIIGVNIVIVIIIIIIIIIIVIIVIIIIIKIFLLIIEEPVNG